MGYAGSPIPSSRCNVEECSNGRHVRLAFRYVFPLWFLSYAIYGFIEASTAGPLTMGLVAYRRVDPIISPDSLMYNVSMGRVDDVRRILRTNRASVLDVICVDGRSALTINLVSDAYWRPTVDMIQSLLLAGADPDLEDDDGNTPRQELARITLSGAIPPEFRAELESMLPLSKGLDSLNLTFLHKIATGICDVDLAKTLQSGSQEILDQLNARDQAGFTPLTYAAYLNDVAKARALIDAGAVIDVQDNHGFTPLMYAVMHSDTKSSCSLDVVDLLLAAGADINLSNRFGSTALHIAAQYNTTDTIRKLLALGAKLDHPDHDSDTPTLFAAIHNSTEALELLRERGADINAANNNDDTSVLGAVGGNSHESLSLLIRLGANHLAVNKGGATLLHTAAEYGDQTTLETLASLSLKGINISAKDSYGWTALEYFEARSPVPDDLTSAFHRLLESLDTGSQTTAQADGHSSDVEDQEFVDAPESI
jgi:ankyrin repeat protein